MSSKQDKLYFKLPYILKVILVNIKGLLNYIHRYNKTFYNRLNTYIKLWHSDVETINEFQQEELKQLLTEAFLYSEWYNKIMRDSRIKLKQIEKDPKNVLKRMPILEKIERKNNADLIVNSNRKLAGIGYTSGTSGSPMVNYIDKESTNISFALWKRFHKTIGLDLKIKQVRFSGRLAVRPDAKKPPFWVYNFFENQLLMSTFHLTENNLTHYINKLNRFKPILIDGFPSAIYILSKYINKNGVLLKFTPKAIAVTSETLHDFQRIEIEKAFNCKVFNQYASSEGSPFITECIAGNLHLNLDSGIFELLNLEGHNAKNGEIARLVVTSFRNLKTPLIRYDIGDLVLLPITDKLCSCGCKMPLVLKIIGREDDMLWTQEKGYVGIVIDVYKGLKGIIKSQIIQNTPSEVKVNMIIDNNFTDQTKYNLLENLKNRLGSKINYEINIVDDIPLGKNGKFIAVKRNFKLK